MNRRQFLMAGAAGLALGTGPALAEAPVDNVIRQLRQQGFSQISTSRTWLGRARIAAERDGTTREIILNPNTGEILRDLWLDADGNARTRVVIADDSDDDDNRGSGSDDDDDGGGSGSDDDGDDGDDDSSGSGSDDDDSDSGDDDSDNSGSGNSGHGSDDSDSRGSDD